MSRRTVPLPVAVMLFTLLAFVMCGIIWLRHTLQKAMHKAEMSIDLGQAIIFHDYRKTEALLRAGANPNTADIDDSLLLAMSDRDDAMVALLRRYGANPSRSLLEVKTVEDAHALIGMGADPNAHVGNFGLTPLADRCINAYPEIVRFLLDHGGDPTVRDDEGWTIPKRLEYVAKNRPEQSAEYDRIRAMLKQALATHHQRDYPLKSRQ